MATRTAPRPVRTPEKRSAFLTALSKGASVSAAAKRASIARSDAYAWKAADPDFSAAWDSAVEESIDILEAECRRRALKQSDLLLIFLLRHRRASVFRPPSRYQVAGDAEGVPIKTEVAATVSVYLPENGRTYPDDAKGKG
jgi:transposase-like protein